MTSGIPRSGMPGEFALDPCMRPYGGFNHNDQALRIVTKLEARYAAFDGLNLSWETLEGLAKHNGPLLPLAAGKSLPATIAEFQNEFDLEITTYAGLEAQIAALSDDIAYNSHDLEDGLRAGFFTMDELADLPLVGDIIGQVRGQHPGLEAGRAIHETIRRLIDRFVRDAIAETEARLAVLRPESAADVRASDRPIVAFSAKTQMEEKILRAFLKERFYHDYRVNRMTSKARRMVRDLFEHFMAEPDTLPTSWQEPESGDAAKARRIADYIAGMTDRYAISEHSRLFDFYQRQQ